jgi:hypothetical protein
MKSLQKRIKTLESRRPSPEEVDARRHAAFLHDCTDRELDLLESVTAAQELGDDPPALTKEEDRIVTAAMDRWSALYAER